MASKRKRITLETKVALIEAVERKAKTNAQICREFDLPSSTLYTILKEKEMIMKAHISMATIPVPYPQLRWIDHASI